MKRLWLGVMIVLVGGAALPAAATVGTTAADATPNFTESGGCGTYGVRGSLSDTTRLGDRIYGPFADFFGRDYGQVSSSIVRWVEPSGKTYRVHQRTLPALQEVSSILAGVGFTYQVRTGAGWVWRTIGGRRQMSQHAVGNALDINPAQNPYRSDGALITDMPPEFVQAWRDAGFCWGGDWRFTKDTMHYTWRGPAVDGGTTPRLAPYPALTPAASFDTKAFSGAMGTPDPASVVTWAMGDRRRDGADDLYSVRAAGGRLQVEVAGAVLGFDRLGVRRRSGLAPTGGPVLLADHDGDGRADLWRADTAGGTLRFDVVHDSDRFQDRPTRIDTTITWTADTEIGLALFDMADWLPDLFVFRRTTNRVEVYSGASGFGAKLLDQALPTSIGGAQVVVADRDVDGFPDVWLIRPGSPAVVDIVTYVSGSGYSKAPTRVTTGMTVSGSDTVVPGDYDGDGRVDLYRVSGNNLSVWLGGVPDRGVADLAKWFTPDGNVYFDAGPECVGECDEIGYVDGAGRWRMAHQLEWGPQETSFYYGDPGDVPFLGDWDCDGTETPGLYRRSDGYVYLRNSNTQGIADIRYFFGDAGDIPLAGDFDGDGCDTVSIYRPSEARFYIINHLGDGNKGLGPAGFSFLFGDLGDQPFAGDFDGDGIDEVGLHRASTGRVYFRYTLDSGIADRDFIYGDPGDYLVAGDWNGDGTDTPAIFRPSTGNWYLKLTNGPGVADHVLPFGVPDPAFRPVAGNTGLGITALTSLECEVCESFDP